jgi:hypothetical protein
LRRQGDGGELFGIEIVKKILHPEIIVLREADMRKQGRIDAQLHDDIAFCISESCTAAN